MILKDKVYSDRELLSTFTERKQFSQYFKDLGLFSKNLFDQYKKALNEIGIDYRGLGNEVTKKAYDKTIGLYVSASASEDRFAICEQDGNPVWVGYCFEDRKGCENEQMEYEIEVTKKALWISDKVRRKASLDGLNLVINVNDGWTAETQQGVISFLEGRYKLNLAVLGHKKEKNPANKYIEGHGYEVWRDHIDHIKVV